MQTRAAGLISHSCALWQARREKGNHNGDRNNNNNNDNIVHATCRLALLVAAERNQRSFHLCVVKRSLLLPHETSLTCLPDGAADETCARPNTQTGAKCNPSPRKWSNAFEATKEALARSLRVV